VIAAQKHGPLRNATVIANNDLIKVVNPDFLTYPDVIADAEFPREFDVDGGFYQHAISNLSAK